MRSISASSAPGQPSTVTRIGLRVAMAAALALALVAVGPAAGAPADPFAGAWASTDHDGSHQRLAFGGSGETRHVVIRDDVATGCGEPLGAARAEGEGVVDAADPNVLVATLDVWCENENVFTGVELAFAFHPSRALLEDSTGVWWERADHCTKKGTCGSCPPNPEQMCRVR